LLDPAGGEPEITPVEIDTTIDIDDSEDDFTQDFDPPPVEIVPPEIDPTDPDTRQDIDTGDNDIPPSDPDIPGFDPNDYD